jgi:hypothetical protein
MDRSKDRWMDGSWGNNMAEQPRYKEEEEKSEEGRGLRMERQRNLSYLHLLIPSQHL